MHKPHLIEVMKALENDPDDAAMGMYIYSTLGASNASWRLLTISRLRMTKRSSVRFGSLSLKLKELLEKYKEFKANRAAPTEAVKTDAC